MPAPRLPGGPATRPAAPAAPRANLGKPVQVTSLADGVNARGLAQLLRSAERLMEQKKFGEALAAYDSAQQVAPNNPLIAVGTAHAEIGAATYRNAEAHLRDAFVRDPALMHAQYDLKKFLGQDHLQVVINDLKDIAKREPNFATPAFLLAYISYNTGNEPQAVTYLDDVEKRLGRPDAVVKLLRANWTLPPAAPANK
jgi:cytochrome c-type biogenesis protein CcmH/NrfG